MFGLTSRKPFLGGKVFVPQKPGQKPTSSAPNVALDETQPLTAEVVAKPVDVPAAPISAPTEPSFTVAKAPLEDTASKLILADSAAIVSAPLKFVEMETPKTVFSFPPSLSKKKSSLLAERAAQIDVDKIMESALVLQQMSVHKPSGIVMDVTQEFTSKPTPDTESSHSDEDGEKEFEEALISHFESTKKTRSRKAKAPAGAASVSAPKRGPGRKKYSNSQKIQSTTEEESSSEVVNASSSSSSSSDGVAAKKRTKRAAAEPKEKRAKKTPKPFNLFPSSFGNPQRVQRVTCYVRIDQQGVDGLTFVNEEDRPVVAEIAGTFPNSAGVKLRDVVVSVNSLDARHAKYEQLMNELICKVPPKPKDAMAELIGITPKNAVYDTMACIVFARPLA